jgi:hypothetical protein
MSNPSGTSSSFSGLSGAGQGTFNQANQLIQGLIGTQAPGSAYSLTPQGTSAMNAAYGSLTGGAGSAQNYIQQILGGSALNPMSNPGTQPTLNLYNQQYTTGLNKGIDSLNALFQNAGQGNSGTEAGLGTQFARGALTDYQNNIGSLLSGLYSTGVGQTENALSQSGLPGQLDLSALGVAQVPQQLQLQQFLEQQQLNQAPISDLTSLTGEGHYSQDSSRSGNWEQNLNAILSGLGNLVSFNFGG